MRQAEGRVEVGGRLDGRAVQDAQAHFGGWLVRLGCGAVGDRQIVDEDAIALLVLIHRRIHALAIIHFTAWRLASLPLAGFARRRHVDRNAVAVAIHARLARVALLRLLLSHGRLRPGREQVLRLDGESAALAAALPAALLGRQLYGHTAVLAIEHPHHPGRASVEFGLGDESGQLHAAIVRWRRAEQVSAARAEAAVEERVVRLEEMAHLILLEQAQPLQLSLRAALGEGLEHGARHAEMQVDGLPTGDGVLVDHWVQHAAVRVHRNQPLPALLLLRRQRVEGGALMREDGTTATFRHLDDVVAHVREDCPLKAAVVVPLRADAQDAHLSIICEPEDVLVGRLRVHAVCGVHLAGTPELACSHLLVAAEDALILEHEEAPGRHGRLQRLEDVVRRFTAEVDAAHGGAEWSDRRERDPLPSQEGDHRGCNVMHKRGAPHHQPCGCVKLYAIFAFPVHVAATYRILLPYSR